MTLPREVLPGCDYMITRRCSERRFFLCPDSDTNSASIYCLGLAARRAKVDVLLVVAMSNHYHAGIHDPDGSLLSSFDMTAARPRFFFRADGEQSHTITVPICRPHGFGDQSEEEWRALVIDQIRAAETMHRERRRAAGKSVLSRQAVLNQKPFDFPLSLEPHFNINPRVAAKSKWARIEALRRSRAFVERYRPAIRSRMDGVVGIVLPFGTYWIRRFAHVACDIADAVQDALAPPQDSPAFT